MYSSQTKTLIQKLQQPTIQAKYLSLTPQNRGLQKLPLHRLLNKLVAFYGPRWIITVFRRALATCPYPEPDHVSPPLPHPISRRFTSTLYYHIQRSLPSCLFPTGFSTKTLCEFLFSPIMCHIPRPSHTPWCYQNTTDLLTYREPGICYQQLTVYSSSLPTDTTAGIGLPQSVSFDCGNH
jgi:hypothetical protein